jgi:hypothetical protein
MSAPQTEPASSFAAPGSLFSSLSGVQVGVGPPLLEPDEDVVVPLDPDVVDPLLDPDVVVPLEDVVSPEDDPDEDVAPEEEAERTSWSAEPPQATAMIPPETMEKRAGTSRMPPS